MENVSYADTVATARQQLEAGVAFDDVLAELRSKLSFIECVRATRDLLGMSLGEAKTVVHDSLAFAVDREDREAFWANLHQVAEAEVQQQSTAAGPSERPLIRRADGV